MKKKLFSLGMATAIAITSAASVSAVNLPIGQSNDLDALDVLVSAALCMNTTTDNLWPNQTKIDDIVPLYSPSGDKVAWYLELTTGEYAVVHNDKGNPAVIEFGEGGNHYVEEILKTTSNPHIIYNSPWDVYEPAYDISLPAENYSDDIYSYYPDLEETNSALATQVAANKQQLLVQKYYPTEPYDSYDDYGFIYRQDLPAGICHSDDLNTSGITWAEMSDYDDIAHWHCAATCATNLIAYFDHIGYDLLENNSLDDTFEILHNDIGDGPVFMFGGWMANYIRDRGYTLYFTDVLSFEEMQNAISEEHPLSVLLSQVLGEMHWVVGIGWREYEPQYDNGGQYLHIITEWDNNTNVYYRINNVSILTHSSEFWIE